MKHSTDRILTTHVGSLPRPADMLGVLTAKMKGQPVNEQTFEARLPSAVADIVRQQAEHGLDVIDDGEVGKPSFILYVDERLSGFEQRDVPDSELAKARHYLAGSREFLAFPEYYHPERATNSGMEGERPRESVCTSPITYKGHKQLQRDIANFKAALARVNIREAFLPAVSPTRSVIAGPTSTIERLKNTSWLSRRRCARSTKRSSMPVSCCRSMIRSWSLIT